MAPARLCKQKSPQGLFCFVRAVFSYLEYNPRMEVIQMPTGAERRVRALRNSFKKTSEKVAHKRRRFLRPPWKRNDTVVPYRTIRERVEEEHMQDIRKYDVRASVGAGLLYAAFAGNLENSLPALVAAGVMAEFLFVIGSASARDFHACGNYTGLYPFGLKLDQVFKKYGNRRV